MRTDVIADAAGVVMLATLTALPISCVPSLPAAPKVNLQPLVATAGAYAVMAGDKASPEPTPVPTDGCDEGCQCGGSGKEPSGDGLAIVNCRCSETCSCKRTSQPDPPADEPQPPVVDHTAAGAPGWQPRNLPH